jgi:hypothetical protein
MTRVNIALVLPILVVSFVGCLAPSNDLAGGPLPASMKGYELYTWTDAGTSWFTLLPGTNRTKTPAEVFTAERDTVAADGWFAITVAGLVALEPQLARLPRDADVFVSTVAYPPGDTLTTATTPADLAASLTALGTSAGVSLQFLTR